MLTLPGGRDIQVRVHGGRLQTSPPPASLPDAMVHLLRQHRDGLVKLLGEAGGGELVVLHWRCAVCRRGTPWRSRCGLTRCRRCHPPAPGAEAVDP
jgi:hypothetical protein